MDYFFAEIPVLSVTALENTKASEVLDCGGGTEWLTASPQWADPVELKPESMEGKVDVLTRLFSGRVAAQTKPAAQETSSQDLKKLELLSWWNCYRPGGMFDIESTIMDLLPFHPCRAHLCFLSGALQIFELLRVSHRHPGYV